MTHPLRAARHRQGLSLQALAARAGVHWITISNIERGRKQPGVDLMLRLADALGVKLDEIVPGARPRRRGLPPTVRRAIRDGVPPLRATREYRGWTARDLAGAAGISSPHYNAVERGVKGMNAEALARIAALLRVSLDSLARASAG